MGDLDGDGDLDFVLGNSLQSNVAYRNEGNLEFVVMWRSNRASNTRGVVLHDVDGNGYLDVVCGNAGDPSTLFLNQNGVLSPDPDWLSALADNTMAIAVGLIDGDEFPDLFCANDGQPGRIYFGAGSTFRATPGWNSSSSMNARAVALGDLDADEDVDVVIGNHGATNVVFTNQSGVVDAFPSWSSTSADFTRSVVLADFDGVPGLDLLFGNDGQPNCLYLNGPGPIPSDPSWCDSVGSPTASLAVGDVDGDGDLDIVCGNEGQPNTLYENADGDLSSVPVWTSAEASFTAALDLADLDGDGDPDLLSGNTAARTELHGNTRFMATIELLGEQVFFPAVTLGDTATAPVTLNSAGNDTLEFWQPLTLPPDVFVSPPIPESLAPGTSVELTFGFAPTAPYKSFGDIVAVTNDPLQPTARLSVAAEVVDLSASLFVLDLDSEIRAGDSVDVLVVPDPRAKLDRVSLFFRRPGQVEYTESTPTSFQLGFVHRLSCVPESGLEFYAQLENSGFVVDTPAADAPEFLSVGPPLTVDVMLEGGEIHARSGEPLVLELVSRECEADSRVVEIESGDLWFRPAGSREAFQRLGFSEDASSRWIAEVPARHVGPRGLAYWVDVTTATSRVTNPAVDPSEHPLIAKTTVDSLAEPSEHPAGAYRMISFPLDFGAFGGASLSELLADEVELGTEDVTRWRVFRYVPPLGEYLELTSGPIFEVEPGRAFWLIARESTQLDTGPRRGLSTVGEEPFPIQLDPGWNQCANPFPFPVAWNQITASDEVGTPHVFDSSIGRYEVSDPGSLLLMPFEGFFIRNFGTEADTLWVPPVEASRAEPTKAARGCDPSSPRGWVLSLTASTTDDHDRVELGVAPGASDTWDCLDRAKPPSPPGRTLRVTIDNDDWESRASAYGRDIRSQEAAGHRWNLVVHSEESAQEASLTGWADGLPEDFSLRLLDLEQGTQLDLRDADNASHSILTYGRERPYRMVILAGTDSYVDEGATDLTEIPPTVLLHQNTPNPFNPATRIRFGIPRSGRVHLGVYNLRGELVRTLVDEQLPAGFRTVVWRGRDRRNDPVASGVYIYRLVTGEATMTRKMVLTR